MAWDVRAMQTADWGAVQAIYAEGIATGDASFESEPPSWPQFGSAARAWGGRCWRR